MKISAAHKVARVLNAMTEAGGTHKVAEISGASTTLVFEVIKDFPLWDYYRKRLRRKGYDNYEE